MHGVASQPRFAALGSGEIAKALGWVDQPCRIHNASGKLPASGSVGAGGRIPCVETQGGGTLTLTVGSDEVEVTEISPEAELEGDGEDSPIDPPRMIGTPANL